MTLTVRTFPEADALGVCWVYNGWPGQDRQRRDFEALPRSVRRRLIRDAQGYKETTP